MSYLLASLFAANLCWFGATLDGATTVPVGPVIGGAATVLLAGMWISRKVTRFETICEQFALQQAANIARLDRLDERLVALDDRMWALERKSQ